MTPGTMSQGAADRGSGTLMTLAAAGVLLVAATVLTGMVAAYGIHQRASAAADLAAIAGVTHPGRECEFAERIARAHDVRLEECTPEGGNVRVVVSAPLPPIIEWLSASPNPPRITGRARAGPA